MTDLKPCPFCGSEKVVFANEEDDSCCIRCTDCGAQVGHYWDYMSDNEDIAGLWNRRADGEVELLALFNGWLDGERYNCDNSEHD